MTAMHCTLARRRRTIGTIWIAVASALALACGSSGGGDGAAGPIRAQAAAPTAPIYGRLRVCPAPNGNRICSESGTPVQLRGMSLFWSNTGWEGARFYTPGAVGGVSSFFGGTVIRAAIGATDGSWNVSGGGYEDLAHREENYARLRTVIDAAISQGLYVIVDWHGHVLLGVRSDGTSTTEDDAKAFFARVQSDYPDSPNIIFETWNEPLSTNYSWAQLKAYHQRVIAAIRGHAGLSSKNLVVAGTPQWSQDVDQAADSPIDPATYGSVAYTLHFYAATHKDGLRAKGTYALSKGVPVFVTEWGTCEASGTGYLDTASTAAWQAWMDQNLVSSLNWGVYDKNETCAAFTPAAASDGSNWSTSLLTTSGGLVRSYLQAGGAAVGVTLSGTGGGAVTSSPAGIQCTSGTCTGRFAAGAAVTLSATPDASSRFDGWSGACTGTGSCVVKAPASATATFTSTVTLYPLAVARSGPGTVTSGDGKIACGSTCSASYPSGTTVTLTATPVPGGAFTGWSGDCTGSGACVVSATAARNVTASFTGPSSVKVSAGGPATGDWQADTFCTGGASATTAAAIDTALLASPVPPQSVLQHERYAGDATGAAPSPFTCRIGGFAAGASVSVTLYFAESYFTAKGQRVFDVAVNGAAALSGFDIYAEAGARNKAVQRTVSAVTDAGGAVTVAFTNGAANFAKVDGIVVSAASAAATLSVTRTGTGGGTVTSDLPGIACGATCSAAYAAGTTVTLTATPDATSTFAGWTGPCTNGTSGATCAVTLAQSQAVGAAFTAASTTQVGVGSSAAQGTWQADGAFCSGGTPASTGAAVDTSLLAGVAVPPQAVLQHERYSSGGDVTCTFGGLAPGSRQVVTMYFVESYFTAAGQRRFDATVNGTQVLAGFDIYAAAGAQNKAVARAFPATADSAGKVSIVFRTGAVNYAKVDGIQVAPAQPRALPLRIAVGGAATADWEADTYCTGGSVAASSAAVNTAALSSPVPPQAVLQHERFAANASYQGTPFTCTVDGLAPGVPHTVTLYFVESYFTSAGQRLFDVSIGGSAVLTGFDILAAAGGPNTAIQRSFSVKPDASGTVRLTFSNGAADFAKVDGILVTSP